MHLKKSTFIALSLLLVGCAKERKYDKVVLEDPSVQYLKSDIVNLCSDVSDPCLSVPSVANTPYNVSASRPYWLGDAKLVITELGQDKLKILEIEEGEFAANPNNLSPVLDFDIEHIDYHCKEDANGDCSNIEEEDKEKPWQNRKFVHFDFNDFDIKEKNTLPIELSQLFSQQCFQELEKKITSFKLEKDALNITIKKTYSTNANCANIEEIADLRYLNFSIDYHYSIVKLSSLASPGYSKSFYSSGDQQQFGFFKTTIKNKTVDYHDHHMGTRKDLINRWKPNRGAIPYYLSSEFYEPGMKAIKDATIAAIDTINRSLTKAKTGVSIELKDGRGINLGDIRNSAIILVKDPQASGVIGYGPTVSNPHTGEILYGRTVMYLGTIIKFISRTYDEFVIKKSQAPAQELSDTDAQETESSTTTQARRHFSRQFMLATQDFDIASALSLNFDYFDRITDNEEEYEEHSLFEKVSSLQKKVERMAKQTFYHSSYLNMDASIQQVSDELFKGHNSLKLWSQLSKAERKKVINILLPFVWTPTLVHEFGHNLGLRHNFMGSVDKDNFYHDHEVSEQHEVSYSSIMDYSYSNINELRVMGKYDIAALKYAYAGLVENEEGKDIHFGEDLTKFKAATKTKIKKFQYCTDEHTSTMTMCNRHDEGVNELGIVNHYIKSYQDNLHKTQYRNNRYDFNSYKGDFDHLLKRFSLFSSIAKFFSAYDQLKLIVENSGDTSNYQEQLAKLKEASDRGFDFFMDILETPAYHCLTVDNNESNKQSISTYASMNKGALNMNYDMRYGCIYLGIQDSSKKYYEFGSYFNNSYDYLTLDRSLIKQNDSSQIDVRGLWIDKMAAAILISQRQNAPTTTGSASGRNYLNHSEYNDRFDKFLKGLFINQFSKKVSLRFLSETGGIRQTTPVMLSYGLSDGHKVNQSYNRIINGYFSLRESKNDFKKILIKELKYRLGNEGPMTQELIDSLSVERLKPHRVYNQDAFNKIVEFKNTQGVVRHKFGVHAYNKYALLLTKAKENLARLKQEELQMIKDLFDPKVEKTPEHQELFERIKDIEIEVITSFKEGRLTEKLLLDSFIALSSN